MVNLLLELTGDRAVNVDQRSNHNSTAFTLACYYGRLDVVNHLLELDWKVDILARDNDGDNGYINACSGKVDKNT